MTGMFLMLCNQPICVQVHLQGKTLSCRRNLKEHVMLASGDPIKIEPGSQNDQKMYQYILLSPTMFFFLNINISCLNINNISPPNIRYIVKLRETVHVEEDPSRSCKNYPYKNFSIYRWVRDVRKNMNTHLAQRLRWQLPGPPLEGYSAWPNASTCESSSNILVKNCMKRRGALDHLLKSNS